VRANLAGASLSLTALVLAQWLHVHYDLARADRQDAVLTPWLLQPGAALGITW
jgi:hypothetical protein